MAEKIFDYRSFKNAILLTEVSFSAWRQLLELSER